MVKAGRGSHKILSFSVMIPLQIFNPCINNTVSSLQTTITKMGSFGWSAPEVRTGGGEGGRWAALGGVLLRCVLEGGGGREMGSFGWSAPEVRTGGGEGDGQLWVECS